MRITIKQISEIAGVHRSTVDKVIHNRPGVSDEVRAKIQKIIEETGYKPNVIGVALKLQEHPKTVSICLLNVDSYEEQKRSLENSIQENSMGSIKVETYATNYDVDEQYNLVHTLIKKHVDGIIMMPIQDEKIISIVNKAFDAGIPVAFISADLPNAKRFFFAGQNSFKAGRTAGFIMASILQNKGDIAVITGSDILNTDRYRTNGFFEYMNSVPDIHIIKSLQTHEDKLIIFKETYRLLQEHPGLQGLYITCGGVSEVCKAVKGANLSGKINVICFDLYENNIKNLKDGVITFLIGQNINAQGSACGKAMCDYLLLNKLPASHIEYTSIDIRTIENID